MRHPAWPAVRPPLAAARKWLDNNLHSLVVIRQMNVDANKRIVRVLASPYQKQLYN